jgi:hypothetical protein
MSDAALLQGLDRALASITGGDLTPAERALHGRVEAFASRLRANRFQLAALGQFKRGKSTLLNALLDAPALPTGAIPLTAIPTFIAYSDVPEMRAAFIDRPAECYSPSAEGVAPLLAELVTEGGNPHNVKGVQRVDVALPARILRDGLVMIDTPGIGSAELHNSETAVAALPECDAALFVLSPDPPITEAELAYLEAVRRQAALVVPVLTKADTINSEDLATVQRYLGEVLARSGVTEPIITVSARAPTAGLSELEARISAIAGDTRRELLERAIARKVIDTLDDLAFQNEASLAALRLPIGQLDSKIATFRLAAQAIGRENDATLDVTSGDRRRLLDMIDQEAGKVRVQAQATLAAEYSSVEVGDRSSLFAALSNRSSALFEDAYRACAALVDTRLAEIANHAGDRVGSILAEMREAAAEALGITFRAPEAVIEIEGPKALAWIERQQESMNPLPAGFLDRFLPMAARRDTQRKWLAREIDRLTTRNTENLRWTLRQQAVEILRRFDALLREQLANAEANTVDLMARARDVRTRSKEDARAAVAYREGRAEKLDDTLKNLRHFIADGRTNQRAFNPR